MRQLPPLRGLSILGILLPILLCGCARNSLGLFGERIDPTKVDEPADLPPTIMLQGQYPAPAALIDQSKTFLGYLQAAARAPQDPALATIFLKSGIALSDRMCLAWFEQLGQAQARAGVVTDDLASLGALSATILGLAKADSRIIGGVAATFLFGKQILNADVAHYIIAADLGTVKGAIVKKRSEQAQLLIAATASNSPSLDFWTAERQLIDYDDQCSHLAIKKYVSDSVAASKADIPPPIAVPVPPRAAAPPPPPPVAAAPGPARALAPRAAPPSPPPFIPITPNTVGSGYLLDPR